MSVKKIASLKGRIDCPYCFSLLEWDSISDVRCSSGIYYVICPECGQHLILNRISDYWIDPTKQDDSGSDDQEGDKQPFLIESIIDANGNFQGSDINALFNNTPEKMKITHQKIGDSSAPEIEFKLVPTPHEDMIWFEDYNEENNLWPLDGENTNEWKARVAQFFDALIAENEEEGTALKDKFNEMNRIYYSLYEVPYTTEAGQSLGNFFNPANVEFTEYENALLYVSTNTEPIQFIMIHKDSNIVITEDDMITYPYDSTSGTYKGSNSDDQGDDVPGTLYIEDILTDNGATILASTIDDIIASPPNTIITSRSDSADIPEDMLPQIEFELIPTPHEDMLWFEQYSEENDLWPFDDEDESTYEARLTAFFDAAIAEDEEAGTALKNKYYRTMTMYYGLYEIPYQGGWGESLGDFFNPAGDEVNYEGSLLYIGKAEGRYIGYFIFINQENIARIMDACYYYDNVANRYWYGDQEGNPLPVETK